MDTVLVINCGSSSLKLALFDSTFKQLGSALAERLGSSSAQARINGGEPFPLPAGADHKVALEAVIQGFRSIELLGTAPLVIGHRVVHGGETFRKAALINDQVIAAIKDCASLAPLHNPVNLLGIHAASSLFPDTPQVAVFDTAFHQTLPRHAFLYALPMRFYRDWGVRRYGFHGTSHAYMAEEAARRLNKEIGETSIISAHLGNGCSITAISKGKSVDTSMGLTPLEGLVMGTRSGDIDPGLFDFVSAKGMSAEEFNRILNHESGLLGLSGTTNDMRSLRERAAEDDNAQVAVEVFCFRLAKYIAAMMVSLEQLDALVFTGGIGENAADVRELTLSHLALLGFTLDAGQNQQHGRQRKGQIQGHNSRFPVLVIPTNEELMIAQQAFEKAEL